MKTKRKNGQPQARLNEEAVEHPRNTPNRVSMELGVTHGT